jgi:hypothetical protein
LDKSADHNKAMRTPIKIYEWYGRYDINDDDKDEEIVAFVCPKYKVLLGWMLSPFPVRPLSLWKEGHLGKESLNF